MTTINSKRIPIDFEDKDTKTSLTEPLISSDHKQQETHHHERKTWMQILKDDLYFICALGSAICFGTHNYVIAYAQQYYPTPSAAQLPECFAYIAIYIIYHLYTGVSNISNDQSFWSKQNSVLFSKLYGSLDLVNIIVVVLRGVLTFLIITFVSLTMEYCYLAGVSPAVVLSAQTLSTFMTVLLFYLLFREKINIKHIIGIVIIMVGIVVLGFSKSDTTLVAADGSSQFRDLLIAFFLILIICVIVAVCAVFPRIILKRGYTMMQFSIDLLGVMGLCFLYAFLRAQIGTGQYTMPHIILISIGAMIYALAILLLNYAYKHGKGGLVMAIVQTQSFYQLIFEILIDKRYPNLFEISSLVMGIIGSAIIAFARK